MKQEVKTAFQALAPRFAPLGTRSLGLFWNKETAEGLITSDGGARQGKVVTWQLLVVNGVPYAAEQGEDGASQIQEVRVYGDTDDEKREAVLAGMFEEWKKRLGLPFDQTKLDEQALVLDKYDHKKKLLLLDITAEEARLFGFTEERDKTIAWFRGIKDEAPVTPGAGGPF